MTHHHLGFEITYRIKCNAYHNENRGTAERNIYSADRAYNYGKNCDNTEEESSHKRYS